MAPRDTTAILDGAPDQPAGQVPASRALSSLGRPLRVMMLGLRGFPRVQGGVENHVENLAIHLVELGCDVEVVVRTPYMPQDVGTTWQGVRLTRLWAPRTVGFETFCHAFLGVLRAGVSRPDVLHIHAIGPAVFTPLARFLGLRVVVTHHSANYENEKWGPLARLLLHLGERYGMMRANGRITVSESLSARMRQAYRVAVETIPNGIPAAQPQTGTAILDASGLVPGRYIVCIARIDQQKRQLDLIEAWAQAETRDWKLALVGAADYGVDYARVVAAAAADTPGVAMLGHRSGGELAELFSHAGAFALPSSHEGQPIAVLEAISYGLPLVLSDIPAHREIAPSGTRYVAAGDIAGLAAHLAAVAGDFGTQRIDVATRVRVAREHDWLAIARRTLQIYVATLPTGR